MKLDKHNIKESLIIIDEYLNKTEELIKLLDEVLTIDFNECNVGNVMGYQQELMTLFNDLKDIEIELRKKGYC